MALRHHAAGEYWRLRAEALSGVLVNHVERLLARYIMTSSRSRIEGSMLIGRMRVTPASI
jgi:hypothetical protein